MINRTRRFRFVKAIGAVRPDVVTQFLTAVMTLSGIGDAIGVAIGLLIAAIAGNESERRRLGGWLGGVPPPPRARRSREVATRELLLKHAFRADANASGSRALRDYSMLL